MHSDGVFELGLVVGKHRHGQVVNVTQISLTKANMILMALARWL